MERFAYERLPALYRFFFLGGSRGAKVTQGPGVVPEGTLPTAEIEEEEGNSRQSGDQISPLLI